MTVVIAEENGSKLESCLKNNKDTSQTKKIQYCDGFDYNRVIYGCPILTKSIIENEMPKE